MNLISLREAATRAGVSVPTASKIAKRLNLGLVVGGRRVVFTASDVAKIKKAKRSGPGNPNFGKR